MSHLLIFTLTCLSVAGTAWAQGRGPVTPPTPPPNPSSDPLLRGFEFRSIGPATMMGRVDDIAGSEKDPMMIYVGFATGGLWKSTDGGNHWKSQFDNMPNESIGAIAIAPSDPNVVYVGTGEANNRQSSSIGDGVWGTTDGGKTLEPSGPGRYAVHRPHRGGPDQSEHRLRGGHGPSVRPQCGARPLSNPRMAARPGRSPNTSTPTPASPMSPSIPSNPKILYALVSTAPAHLVGI